MPYNYECILSYVKTVYSPTLSLSMAVFTPADNSWYERGRGGDMKYPAVARCRAENGVQSVLVLSSVVASTDNVSHNKHAYAMFVVSKS